MPLGRQRDERYPEVGVGSRIAKAGGKHADDGHAAAVHHDRAPDHARVAAELCRVCRPGGRLALTAWTKDDWSELHAKAGRTFSLEADAREWSEEERVRALLGEAFELSFATGDWRVEADSGDALWELLSNSMPPLRSWLASVDDATRAHAENVYRGFLASGVLERKYVLVMGARR